MFGSAAEKLVSKRAALAVTVLPKEFAIESKVIGIFVVLKGIAGSNTIHKTIIFLHC